ncbi:hypothetical protein THRCLA_20320 [Thraustotheca clavata]|uniref:BZIP domain-containing protein n=1 Tax=Thraustotheca clavata TaxID=74557 RepID=A0A1W0A8U9_9STRA|nr:hypothetical protein THRCLA_20320 [Thraustotheca clavata]
MERDDRSPSPSTEDEDYNENKRPRKNKRPYQEEDGNSGGENRKLKNREAAALSRRRNKDRMEQLQRRVFDMETMNTRLRALVDELQWKMVSHGYENEIHECHAQAGIVVNGNHIAIQSPKRKLDAPPVKEKRKYRHVNSSLPSPSSTMEILPKLPPVEQRKFPSPFTQYDPQRNIQSPYMYPPLLPPQTKNRSNDAFLENPVSALLDLQYSQPADPPSRYPPYQSTTIDQTTHYLPYRSN